MNATRKGASDVHVQTVTRRTKLERADVLVVAGGARGNSWSEPNDDKTVVYVLLLLLLSLSMSMSLAGSMIAVIKYSDQFEK